MTRESFHIYSEVDIPQCITSIRNTATQLRFPKIDIEQFLLAVSEITMNAIRHGGGGILEFSALEKGILRVTIQDEGKGIVNINEAMEDGFSAIGNSLGIGLRVAERSVDHMQIKSAPGEGTSVILEKHRPIDPERIDYGIVSLADAAYTLNGDQYIIKEYNGDSVLLGVIDGPGQGYDAYAVAHACKTYVEANYLESLDRLLEDLDEMIYDSNDDVGIAACFARITPDNIMYKGHGDTHSYLYQEGKLNRLFNEGARLGQLNKYRKGASLYQFDKTVRLIMCSDGIATLADEVKLSGSSQVVANKIFDNNHRVYGDATVLSVKYSPYE